VEIPADSYHKPNITPAKRRETWENLLAGLAFCFLSVELFGRTVIFSPSSTYIGHGPDPSQYMWALVWWPHALARRLNPFMVSAVWAPLDYNLAWFTSIPGPSLIVWPVTRLLGPVVAYNLWCMVAPATAAWGGFILCRYVARSFWSALLGGYLFGFSSYMVGQMFGHLDLVTIFPVPIAVLLVLLRLDKAISPVPFVLALTVTLTFQFLASPEVFATMTFFGAIAICIAVLVLPREWRATVYSVLVPISAAYLATAVLSSPFLYYMLVRGEPAPFNSPLEYSTDVLNFMVPVTAWLGGHSFHPITARFHGNHAENGAYLGLPLIVILYLCARSQWDRPTGKLLVYCLLFISLASLGPRMHVAGLNIVPLPWMFFQALPLMDQALPARFMMYSFLIAAIMTAIYLRNTELHPLVKVVLGVLTVLFIWPSATPISKLDTPNFFASGTYRQYLAENDTVIILPFGDTGNSLLWQAQTDMYFRMAGAYMDPPPSQSKCWPVLNTLHTGHTITDFSDRLKLFLVAHGVKAIIVTRQVNDLWLPLLATIGTPIKVTDVSLYRVTPGAATYTHPNPTDGYLLRLETRIKLRRYAELILAADKYVSQELPRAKLTPWEVERLNLLSSDWSDGPAPSSPNGSSNWQDDLWLGRWGSDEIGVGITGCREIGRAHV